MAQLFKWLQWPLPQKLASILGHKNIRFVGGAVRDSLIDLPINDIDAATPLLPEIVYEKLTNAGISVIPTGLKHGTVTAHQDGVSIEITTLRVDAETDGRHAKVEFTDDWQTDASRRDFTFNALYVDIDGKLYDPFEGIDDLHTGIVRFIGEPAKRIEEDYLRILRFFRFYARYGKGAINSEGLKACFAARDKLATLSVERIRDEFLKLSLAPNVLNVANIMEEHQIITACYPDAIGSLKRLQTVLLREDKLKVTANQLARFAAILGYEGEAGATFARYFKLSNKDQTLFKKIPDIAALFLPNIDTVDRILKIAVYKFGIKTTEAALLLMDHDLTASVGEWTEMKDWTIPTFPIKGGDLLKIGLEPGPEISKMLNRLEQLWLDQDFIPSKDELLDHAL